MQIHTPLHGKTILANFLIVPLYMMAAGDLGCDSDDVEEKLTQILEMISNWNAILLLDECDIFLEERLSNNLQRNKVVSIFLRTLEYYEGILFLTTNRVDNMDPAFQSRIHMHMAYHLLGAHSRKTVWKNFLDRMTDQ